MQRDQVLSVSTPGEKGELYATDAKVQDTLREFKGSTIITIAHRLQTIVDHDKVLVLEKGELARFGPPWELIAKENGIF